MLALPPKTVIPVDTPPWWWMKKKTAMFYVGAGRGDHARTTMATATLCTDDIAEARAIDEYFPDVRAYILGIEPPAYPFAIDAGLAASGEAVSTRPARDATVRTAPSIPIRTCWSTPT